MVAPGPVVKLAITKSSSDNVNASSHPAVIAGKISGTELKGRLTVGPNSNDLTLVKWTYFGR